jgi:hypothetical protein
MDEPLAMEVSEGVHGRFQHGPGLDNRKSPVGEHLRQILLGALHYNVYEWLAIKHHTSHFVDRNQVRVRKSSGLSPARELQVTVIRASGDKLDGSLD